MKTRTLILSLIASVWIVACSSNAKGDKFNASGNSEDAIQTSNTSSNASSAGEPIHINKAVFLEKVYNFENNPNEWSYAGTKPCIVDFYADWCRPCKMIAPYMAELASTYKDQIVVYKINIDEEREIAQFFGIQSIPTVLFCPMKGKPQMTQGALPKEDFEKAVREILLKSQSN
ncbi:MAG: thioredoxin [Bacteroidetes bacterium]|nr:thioredoxin [Bacteroidota bacterium]